MSKVILAFVVSLSLNACATTQKPLPTDFDFGEIPSVTKVSIEDFFKSILKDPESATFRYEEHMFKVACNRHIFKQYDKNSWTPYWAKVVSVNGRNSYGGYTGFKRFAVFMNDGRPVQALTDEDFRLQGCRKIK